MGDTPSFNDRFARRPAPGASGLGASQDHFRKSEAAHGSDPFAARASGAKPPKVARPAKKAPASDPFAQKAKAAAPATAKPAPNPFARAPLHPPKTRTPPPAPKPSPAARVAPIAAAASFYNPFGKPAAQRAEKTPAQIESSRTPLHVVPAASAEPVEKVQAKMRPAGRSSSLVLVSNTATVAAAETLEAPPPPVAEKLPEPPAVDPAPAPARPRRTGGGGSGGRPPGGGPPRAAAAAAAATTRRGFNQDDLFGLIFGLAVIAFLLLWLMRGRSEQAPVEEGLVGVQSAANLATPPAPPVDPFGNAPVDLRPSGPIPEPLPEPATTEATPPPAAAPVTPTAAAAPPAAANPPVATPATPPAAAVAPSVPLAERKMNGWFCTASSTLTKASKAALETELATFADVFAGKELVVRGYADTRGSTEFNAALGGERARVVADFLRTKGLQVAEYTGIGELDGLDDNQNCPNQRRVDVWVKGGPAAAPSRECAPEPEVAQLVCS
jgi:outer membrane protein OmpA-like peptidoglycan-associated protein